MPQPAHPAKPQVTASPPSSEAVQAWRDLVNAEFRQLTRLLFLWLRTFGGGWVAHGSPGEEMK